MDTITNTKKNPQYSIIALKRKFILKHNLNCYNSYVSIISLDQAHILLDNGTEDLTKRFTNELPES